MIYETVQGDMWDVIAQKIWGHTSFTNELIKANTQHVKVYQFSAGVKLTIPDIDESVRASYLPPWKRVSG